MNVERLLELANLLETIPEDNFNLVSWGCNFDELRAPQKELIECGTVCCAVGWACSHPPFNEQGLQFNWNYLPSYKNKTSWSAVTKFFEIPDAVADYLFLSSLYQSEDGNNPQAVIERIRDIVKDTDLYTHISNGGFTTY